MNPQMVAAKKSIGVLEVGGKVFRRTGWIAIVGCSLAFASQASRAEDAATDLVAQFDAVAQYCEEHGPSKGDDQYKALVGEYLSSASAADLAKIRKSSDYQRIENYDRSRLSADHNGAAAACVALGNLAAHKLDRPEIETPRQSESAHR
jgi:hypothetical protein